MNYLSTRLLYFISFIILQTLLVSQAFAVPNAITLQTKIIKPSGDALEAPSVNFQISTLDALGTCVLYVETFGGVSMVGSSGVSISTLGSGGQVYSATGGAYSTIFSNAATPLPCQAGGNYTPAVSDRRKVVIQFHDGSAAGWQTLPPVDINSVPYSMFAGNAEKFSDHAFSEFTLKTAFPDCNTAGKVLTFNGTAFTCVSPSAGSGTVTGVTSANSYVTVTGTTAPVLTANVGTAANTLAAGNDTRITGAAQKASNLSDLASAATARTNLGSTTTGDALFTAATATAARTTLGLGSAALLTAGTAATNLVQLDGSAKIPVALLPTGTLSSSTSFVGDVTGTSGATVVSMVGAKTAAEVVQSVTDTLAATTANTASTIVKRNASGDISVSNLGASYGITSNSVRIGFADGAINASAPMFANNVPMLEVGTGDISPEEAIVFRKHSSSGSATLRRLGYIMKMTNEVNTTESSKGGGLILESTAAWAGSPSLSLVLADQKVLTAASGGNIGIGMTAPTAALQLKAGAAAAGSAPLKLTSGTNLTTAESGAIEFDGSNLYYTDSTPTRRTIATTTGGGSFSNVSAVSNGGGNISLSPNTTTGSVLVTATTASTGASNGALVVSGGVGVGGDIYATSSINAGTTITALSSILTPQIYGSSSASGNIKIDGTSNATKGNVLLATAGGSVGIGTSTVGSMLTVAGNISNVDGSANERVRLANASGMGYASFWNGATLTTQISGGAASYFNGGSVGIGTSSPTAALSVVNTSSAATAGEEYGIYLYKNYAIADTSFKQGLRLNTNATHTTGTIASLLGAASIVSNTAAGTTTNAYGYWGRVDSSSASGTIGGASVFKATDGTGAGTITNQYGLYVDQLVKGSTANYAIYTNGTTPSSLGGKVGVGSNNAPTSTLEVTSSSANAFAVGAAPTTFPAFAIDASATTSVTGIKLSSAAAAGGVLLQTTSSGSDENVTLAAKGNGSVLLSSGATGSVGFAFSGTTTSSIGPTGANLSTIASNNGTLARFKFTGASDLNISAGVEAQQVVFNMGQSRQHGSNTAIALQRDFRIIPNTHTFGSSGGVITNTATLAIDGPAQGSTNGTLTNSSAIYVPTSAVTNVTNSFGLNIAATTGATNNYAAVFTGGNVGVGTAAPTVALDVSGSMKTTGQISSGSQTVAGGTSAVDWNGGNAISTDYNCGSTLSFANMRDGGTYTLVITGTGTTTCNFPTSLTGADAATVSYRFNPANGARTASTHTVYTFMRVGAYVYVSWSSGF